MGAGDVYHNDGPFDNPDDYNRLNAVLRYHRGTDRDFWTLTGMAYSGKWNSTDQVPEHAITAGLIGRYGSLNPTDGGGFNGSKTWYATLGSIPTTTLVGVQGRFDDIRGVGIDATYLRQYLYTTQNAGVLESNGALYAENSTSWTDKLRTVLGLREDEFDFDVTDKMRNADGSCNIESDPLGCNTGDVRAHIFSPKLGIVLGPWSSTSYFITVAEGYHSNDARGVTRSGENPDAQPVTPLTRATSAEVGVATNPVPRWHTTLDLFLLKLKSELVFDGDAGVTEPSGATTRTGVEWGNELRINPWLRADFNAAFSRARFDHNVDPDDLGCGDAAPSHPCTTAIAITGRYVPKSRLRGASGRAPYGARALPVLSLSPASRAQRRFGAEPRRVGRVGACGRLSALTLLVRRSILSSPAVPTLTSWLNRESGASSRTIPELPRSGNWERPAPKH